MKVKLFLFLVLCLCVSGCDEGMLVSEQVFFGGGEVEVPAKSTVGPLPEDLQVLLFGDRDDYLQQLLALPDAVDGKVAVRHQRFESDWFMELEAAQEWLLDQICMIDAQREYYTKYIDAGGVVIMGHDRVDDKHFYNAREVVLTMTSKRPELRERLTPHYEYAIAGSTTGPKSPRRFRMVIFPDRFPLMPEYFPYGKSSAGGCGAWCNAMVFDDRTGRLWSDYHVVVHEFGHAIHFAINDFHIPGNPVHDDLDKLDETFQSRLEAAYAVAKADAVDDWEASLHSNKYHTGDYAMTNVNEYWAEGVAYWFEYVSQVWPEGEIEGLEGRLRYHDDFLEKDPLLYALIEEWFPLLSVELPISRQ